MGAPGAATPVGVRVLGPVLLGDGGRLPPRERAVCARLAIDVGRAVAVDRLIADLWGDTPPPRARNALQVYVSHLRRLLGPASISSAGGSYTLVGEVAVDAVEFDRLVTGGGAALRDRRPRDAVEQLDKALALWRGEPFADMADHEFVRVEHARLSDVRATAVQCLAEALLAVGELARLTDELAPLVRVFPFRERLRAAVMRGLYRQGRAVEALTLYTQVRKLLRDELGLDPGPELQALQAAILADDPVLIQVLPQGPVTLMFTDIERSAALLTRLGDEYGGALMAQRRLLRDAFAAHAGHEVASEGDRLLVVFAEARDAVVAAINGQRRLADHEFPGAVQVRVRMGLHTGTPRLLEGGYVGMDVHRAARICAAAAGGQVLASADTIRALGASSSVGETEVLDVGRHQLRDVPHPEHLHQITAPGLESAFAPPRSLGGRSNLPRAATPLVGRAAELGELVRELSRERSGLVTLLGPGGVGKTRLAVEVARQIGRAYPGGVYFAGLETCVSADALRGALGEVLGLASDARSWGAVVERLEGMRTMLVLDNLEQLPDAGVVLQDLLDVDGEVRLLATSRRPTGVSGERRWPIEPLADADGEEGASEVFAQYAALARPGFVLHDGNRNDVSEICRRLDGLPLAIELAASRVRALPPRRLLAGLPDTLGSVAGASRPRRQRSLRHLTSWSYDLLPPHQQVVLEGLSVFRGGVDLDTFAAAFSADEHGGHEPVEAVVALADASLVRIDPDADPPRITLLETIRDFAAEKLVEVGRSERVRDAHLAAYLDLARRLTRQRANSVGLLDRVVLDQSNFESALTWALAEDGTRADQGVEILYWLGDTWMMLGDRAWAFVGDAHRRCRPVSEFYTWISVMNFRHHWDKSTDSQALLEEVTALEQQLRERQDLAAVAFLLSFSAGLGADLDDTGRWQLTRAWEGFELARSVGEPWLVCHAASGLLYTLLDAGDPASAHPVIEEAVRAAETLGDPQRLDSFDLVRARLLHAEGRGDDALIAAAGAVRGLITSRSQGRRYSAASNLAVIMAPRHPEAAARLNGIAQATMRAMGSIMTVDEIVRQQQRAAPAVASLGVESYERILAEARSWRQEEATEWVLQLADDLGPRHP